MARQYLNLAQVYGAIDEANARKQQAQYQQMQMDRQGKLDQRADQDYARQDQVRGIYKGAIEQDETGAPKLNEKKLITDLYGIAPEQALSTQESFTKRDNESAKAKRENQKFEIENKTATVKYLKDRLSTVQDDNSYQAFRNEAEQLGAHDLVASAPQQYDPSWQQNQMVNADKFLERNTPKYERVDLGGKIQVIDTNPVTNPKFANMNLNKTQSPDSLASNELTRRGQAITMRGQDMTDARSREANANGGKAPAGYRFNPDGTLTAIPGGPGDKTLNPTEVQGKASLFSKRALEADKILGSIGQDYSPYGINAKQGAEDIPIIGGIAGPAANAMLSDKSQQAEQAQRDFVNAVLRQESGAAIGQSEFNNARKQYFTQPGDSQAVIAQKANNRRTAIEGLNTMAGPLKSNIPAASSNAPKLGTVDGGYVFMGGNPSDPKSWKKK